jgi:hypothetical protein
VREFDVCQDIQLGTLNGQNDNVSVAKPADQKVQATLEAETLYRQDRRRELILSDIFQPAFGKVNPENLE